MLNIKKTIATSLIVILTISALPVQAFAAQPNTQKEEVVYANLNADGSVKEINIVNIFDLDASETIVDYGEYENIRNMTTTDSINYKDNMITIDASAGKLYYEGRVKVNSIPWIISIKYYIDDKEYSPKEIAGMSGKLKIKMAVKQNKNCDSSFFKAYALQASFVLDTDKASDITAEGATIANVGSNKQITYTILPNNEKDIVVEANVKNFEMDAISINAVRMSLDMDIDSKSLHDKINDVIDAVDDLDNGAGELNNGAGSLYSATGALNSSVGKLYKGVGSLYSGAVDLKNGLKTLSSKNSALKSAAWSTYKALCSSAQTQLNAQLSENGLETVTLTPKTYSKVLSDVLKKMDADKVYNQAYNAAMAEVTKQVNAQADTLYSEYIKSQADSIYLMYVNSQAKSLYTQVASEAVYKQLMENGLTEEQANAYLQTNDGKAMVSDAVASMSDEQKEQIISAAVQSLTPEQKEQILKGATGALTSEQKTEIKDGYIKQMMASEKVTTQINNAVKKVNSAAAEITALKGQLDGYNAFYTGLTEYLNGVKSAANGSKKLAGGLSTLYSNTKKFKKGIGDLNIAVGSLKTGTGKLKTGTEEFSNETSDIDTKIDDEIGSMTSSLTGKDVKTVSFASSQNTNIKSVQFVIQTEKIEIAGEETVVTDTEEHLTFWQKFLKLFGLY